MKLKKEDKLGRQLILDELFDLLLYKEIYNIEKGELEKLLKELIPIEEKHFKFWQDFFHLKIEKLDFSRRLKLSIILFFRRLLGEKITYIILESIEIYGIRKYLLVWDKYKNTKLGNALKEILKDEFKHEEDIVSRSVGRRISGDKIRDIFLGLNDGLVEILGAVSGFFAAFASVASILVASLTVAVAGSLSMAAGVFIASNSEKEIERTEEKKRRFLKEPINSVHEVNPVNSSFLVGMFYLLGAMIPILPIILGARNIFVPILAGGVTVIIVSFIVAFISGMDIKKRIIINLGFAAIAVIITYSLASIAQSILGINL